MINEEFLDIFDEEMNYLGIAPRSEVHKKASGTLPFNVLLFKL